MKHFGVIQVGRKSLFWNQQMLSVPFIIIIIY